MSSSSEAGAVRASEARVPHLPELRVGQWTRLGGDSVLGDPVTETLLGGIAAQARDSARAQGYAVGWAEGRRAAAEQAQAEEQRRAADHAEQEAARDAEHRAAIDALGHAAEQVRGLLGDLVAHVEDQAAELAWAVTREVLGHAVASLTPADVVARALQVLPAVTVGRVRLHPSVASSPDVQDLAARGLEVLADPGLGTADVVVEAADGSVTDLRVDEAMARVREVLR